MKKIIYLTMIFAMIVAMIGCNAIDDSDNVQYDKEEINDVITNKSAEFAFDIFRELNKEDLDKNIFISPLSISTALSMTLNGAVGDTKTDMIHGLRYDGVEIEEINNTYKNLLLYLDNVDEKVELNISNSIWYRQGEAIKEEFFNVNKDIFDAEVNEIDFSKEDAADIINGWIKNATKGKIEKMLEPPINQDVIMYLINAIYFKGEWTEQFSKDDTFDTNYHNIDGIDEEIEMMSRFGKVYYGANEDYKTVKLPYGDEKISMYFILPEDNENINDFIENMDLNKFSEIRNNINEMDDVILQIPKYKLEYGIKNLNNALINMGMGSAFDERADFSKIREDIFISRVLHKAVIEVNEEGSEAAAVTVVELKATAIMEPISFIADRPFVFLIMDEETETILFMGKYCKK